MIRFLAALTIPMVLLAGVPLASAYDNTFTFPYTMVGPGTAACDDPIENEVGSDIGGTGVAPGTYAIHTMTFGPDDLDFATFTVEYDGVAGTELAAYLFFPGSDAEDCDTAFGMFGPSDSPLTFFARNLPEPGQYQVRLELDGVAVDGYTLTVHAE